VGEGGGGGFAPGGDFCCLLPVRQPAPHVVHRAVSRGDEASAQTVHASRSAVPAGGAPALRTWFCIINTLYLLPRAARRIDWPHSLEPKSRAS
jgi:hypothetical protein